MEYCGGGSVSDLLTVMGKPLEEGVIAYICSEALKVWGGVGRVHTWVEHHKHDKSHPLPAASFDS